MWAFLIIFYIASIGLFTFFVTIFDPQSNDKPIWRVTSLTFIHVPINNGKSFKVCFSNMQYYVESILIYYTSHDCLTSNGVSGAFQNFTKIQCIYEEKSFKVFSYYEATFAVIHVLNICMMVLFMGILYIRLVKVLNRVSIYNKTYVKEISSNR